MTDQAECKKNDIQAGCRDWQGQKTDSFSTLGKSEEDKKMSKKQAHIVSDETTRLSTVEHFSELKQGTFLDIKGT